MSASFSNVIPLHNAHKLFSDVRRCIFVSAQYVFSINHKLCFWIPNNKIRIKSRQDTSLWKKWYGIYITFYLLITKGIFNREQYFKIFDIWIFTFRCSSPAKVAGFNDISRCISNIDIPSRLDAVHMSGRENCMEADIPPIANIKFPSPIDLSLVHTRFNSRGQGRWELITWNRR